MMLCTGSMKLRCAADGTMSFADAHAADCFLHLDRRDVGDIGRAFPAMQSGGKQVSDEAAFD